MSDLKKFSGKFTKGEWVVFDKEPDKYTGVKINNVVKMPGSQKSKYGANIYLCIGGFDCETQKEEVEANAFLIAAAPEMYRLLKELHEKHILFADVNSKVIKLLNKATGQINNKE